MTVTHQRDGATRPSNHGMAPVSRVEDPQGPPGHDAVQAVFTALYCPVLLGF